MTDLMGWAALTSTMLNYCEFGCLFGADSEIKDRPLPRAEKIPTL
jgi:hypothetical protein